MYTVWVRLNTVVSFGFSSLFGFACLAALSKVGHSLYRQPVISTLELNKLRSLKSHGGVDRALLSLDLNADMDPAFHWNIKQLFVYIVASYETEENPVNQVVLWDSIVENVDENKLLQQNNVFVKYALVDPGDALRGKDITLSLHWDHMPLTGFMFQGHQDLQTASQFTLPNEYQ